MKGNSKHACKYEQSCNKLKNFAVLEVWRATYACNEKCMYFDVKISFGSRRMYVLMLFVSGKRNSTYMYEDMYV